MEIVYGYGPPLTRARSGWVIFWILLFGGGFGTLLTVSGLRQQGDARALDAEGIRVSGVVTEHETLSKNHTYLDVSYQVGSKNYLKSFHVKSADYFKVPDGAAVQVAYMKGDPYDAKLTAYEYGGQSPGSFIAVGFAIIAFSVLASFGIIVYVRCFPKYT